MKIIKIVKLAYQDEKSDKVHVTELLDNKDVKCSWGRRGAELQTKLFEGAGEAFFDKKVASKLKKGYEIDEND